MIDCLPQIHMVAIHATPGYQDTVPGFAALCEYDRYLAGVGTYKNSIGRVSEYAMVGAYAFQYEKFRVGAIAGVVNGYRDDNGVSPLGGVITSYKLNWHGIDSLNTLLVPPVQGLTPAFIQFNITLELPK